MAKEKTLQTIKIKITTVQKLRMLYALSGDKMTEIVDRLVAEELSRVEGVVITPNKVVTRATSASTSSSH